MRRDASSLRRQRGRWYWLSFANNQGFLGGGIAWAHNPEAAVHRARRLRITEGFSGQVEVFCEPIAARVMNAHIPLDLRNRLLAQDEIVERLRGRSARLSE